MALDGARPVFRHLPAPTATERAVRVQEIAARIGIALQRRGLIERDIENAWLAALGPPPRMHLTRYHGVVAPRSPLRGREAQDHRQHRRVGGDREDARAPGEERS